tara:strand:- start:8770 stop:11319 length:2550 start_codon:yes stop_codon:yes gene_type:complete
MALDNEYKAKGETASSSESKNSWEKKSSTKKTSTSRKKKRTKKKSPTMISSITDRINTKKLKSSIGVGLLLAALFIFLANFSYLLTWREDQNRVLETGFFQFLFDGNETPVANWLGKFGAWTSHLLIYRWFGIASFGIPLLLTVWGIKALFNRAVLPLRKATSGTILFTIWFSLLFGFFSNQVNYLGGTFGYQINEWFALTLGKFGTIIFIIAFGYIFGLIVFNLNLGKLVGWFKAKDETDEAISEAVTDVITEDDLSVTNTLKEEDKLNDDLANTVTFGEKEEEIIEEEKVEEELTSTVVDEMDVTIPEEDPIETTDDELLVKIAATEEDEVLTEEDVNSKRDEFGEYDPKLDLSSYKLPSIDLLKAYGKGAINIDKKELEENKNKIVTTLQNYKIEISKIMATVGPTVTLYEIVPAPGVRISKIKNLEDDIALSLAALGIRIIAPIPGKGTIGIEVPNSKPEMVSMRSLIASKRFQELDAELPIVMGKTITNETFTFDLAKMPHLLVAGATGQGKSVGLNAILVSLLYKKHPAQVKFVLVDPKKVELTLYNKIERHFLAKLPDDSDAIITDTSKVVDTLNSLCIEMDERYELLKTAQVRNIKEYNAKFIARKLNPEKGHRYLPYIVVLIDEFADLIMTAGKEVEHPIARIAQLARAIGIHLIVATQRPSVNVITGMIKANFPARIAFRVQSKIDSRTILDGSGADQLIGRGDMLISTGSELVRLQCGFVDTPEVEDICNFIGDQRGYADAFLLPEYVGESSEGGGSMDDEDLDSLFADAARIVVIHQQGSASLLQRKLKLGYNRAGRIVDQLEGMGIIGQFRGSKAREVLIPDEISLNEILEKRGLN